MIPTQTLAAFPEFGNSSTKVKPDDTKYSAGFVNADVVPYEWVNYLHNKASVGITDLNSGVSSMEKELNAVVTAGGATPSESSNNQVLNAINYLIAQAKSEAILAAHPIGSLYWSSKDTDPNKLFGGTWTRIKDKFILACGDTYKTVGATGGASTVTLTTSNMPSHSHSFTPAGKITMNAHTHTVPNHYHTMKHTHNYTPSGTISNNGAHYHFYNSWNTFDSDTYDSSSCVINDKVNALNAYTCHSSTAVNYDNVDATSYAEKGSTKIIYPGISYAASDRHYGASGWSDADGNGEASSEIVTLKAYTFQQKFTSYSGYHGHTFTGTTKTTTSISTNITSTVSQNISSVTTTGSFTGSTGTTSSTGGGSSFSILPPYLVKYCWERTA